MQFDSPLIDAIARRRCILYLGAGVTASCSSESGARAPGWDGFLEGACDRVKTSAKSRLAKRLIRKQDYLTACDVLKSELDDEWDIYLKECFQNPRYRVSELQKTIFQLDASVVLTPNFDNVYASYVASETQNTTTIHNYYDSDTGRILRQGGRAVVKVHGSLNEPTKMVFTRSAYAHARNNYPAFYELMHALFITNTVFFIGTSLSDPDLLLFLENMKQIHASAPFHYMTTPTGEIDRNLDEFVKNNYNIKLARYKSSGDHVELQESLKGLVDAVSERREELKITGGW